MKASAFETQNTATKTDPNADFFGKSATPDFFSPATIQPKLTIGQPNDKYEKEADAMADRIVSGETNTSTPASSHTNIQRACADCGKEEGIQRMSQEEEEAPIQRMGQEEEEASIQRMTEEEEEIQPKLMRKSADGGGVATAALSSQLNSSKGGGSPMSADTNASMSQAFGTDFSQVRVHTGSSAIQMNQGLNARAFTHGSDVYFNSGEYNPGSKEGKRLLGHELTHVVQQGGNERIQNSSIQRSKDRKYNKKSWLELEIPNGTYVLEALNMPCKVSHHAHYHSDIVIYATAGQFMPLNENGRKGLYAHPHKVVEDKRNSSGEVFRIRPDKKMISKAGEGTAKIQVYDKHWYGDSKKAEVKLRFNTIPLIAKIGKSSLITKLAHDMNPSKHKSFELVKGGNSGENITYSESVTNGFTLSKGRAVTNTISSKISSEIGVDIKIAKAGVGSEVSASESVTNSITTSTSLQKAKKITISKHAGAQGAGKYVIVPSAQIWKTEVVINEFDVTGKFTGTKKEDVYTFIYNDVASVLNLADDGKTLIDSNGNFLRDE